MFTAKDSGRFTSLEFWSKTKTRKNKYTSPLFEILQIHILNEKCRYWLYWYFWKRLLVIPLRLFLVRVCVARVVYGPMSFSLHLASFLVLIKDIVVWEGFETSRRLQKSINIFVLVKDEQNFFNTPLVGGLIGHKILLFWCVFSIAWTC